MDTFSTLIKTIENELVVDIDTAREIIGRSPTLEEINEENKFIASCVFRSIGCFD